MTMAIESECQYNIQLLGSSRSSVKCSVLNAQSCLFVTPRTLAHQPLSMGFSRQECWSGLPFPSPGELPDQGSNPSLLHCRQILYHLSHQEVICRINELYFSGERRASYTLRYTKVLAYEKKNENNKSNR